MGEERMADVDATALLLTTLAELRGVPNDAWAEGSRDELALRLHRARALAHMMNDLADAMELELVESMDTDVIGVLGGGQARREPVRRSAWNDESSAERMRDDLAHAVAHGLALDLATGEVDIGKRNIALAAVRGAYEAIPSFSTLKQGGAKRLGLRVGDYRRFDTTYKVVIETPEDL